MKTLFFEKIFGFSILIGIFAFCLPAKAEVYPSQCQTGQISGLQTECTHENDQKILTGQCVKHFSGTVCASMGNYLSAMTSACQKDPAPGVSCQTISQNGFYGRDASAYAAYHLDKYTLGSGGGQTGGGGSTGGNPSLIYIPEDGEFGLSGKPIKQIITRFLFWLLGILGAIAVISFVISGMQYFLAAGSERDMETAKKTLTYSILGVIVAISGLVVIKAIDAALNANPFF